MKFEISIAGAFSSNGIPPCKEAIWGSYTYTDIRHVQDYRELPDKDTWFESGNNHREKDGCVMRDFVKTGWLVNFETIEDVLAFCAKYGAATIEDFGEVAVPTIKIYKKPKLHNLIHGLDL